MNSEQFSLVDANKLLHKSKDSKLSLVVKRGSSTSTPSCAESVEDSTATTTTTDGVCGHLTPVTALSSSECAVSTTTTDSGPSQQQQQQFKPIKSHPRAPQPPPPPVSSSQHMNLRSVVFAREGGIGIRLAGGNRVGLFICDVQYNSSAERAGLRIGDKIVKVNGVDFLTLTREEAVQHMLNATHSVIEMLVSYCPEDYEANAFDPAGGDSMYVRAHFNYTAKSPNELSFKINDVLHITDTLHNGIIGQWVATKLGNIIRHENN